MPQASLERFRRREYRHSTGPRVAPAMTRATQRSLPERSLIGNGCRPCVIPTVCIGDLFHGIPCKKRTPGNPENRHAGARRGRRPQARRQRQGGRRRHRRRDRRRAQARRPGRQGRPDPAPAEPAQPQGRARAAGRRRQGARTGRPPVPQAGLRRAVDPQGPGRRRCRTGPRRSRGERSRRPRQGAPAGGNPGRWPVRVRSLQEPESRAAETEEADPARRQGRQRRRRAREQGSPGHRQRHGPDPRPRQPAAERLPPDLPRRAGQGPGQGIQGPEGRSPRRAEAARTGHGLVPRRRPGQRTAAAADRPAIQRREEGPGAARAGRQGHHLRHRRHQPQAGSGHGRDEVRHVRRRQRLRHLPRGARLRSCRSTWSACSPAPRTCPAAEPPVRATSSPP